MQKLKTPATTAGIAEGFAAMGVPLRGQIIAIEAEGDLRVRTSLGDFPCDWLETGDRPGLALAIGNWVVVLPPADEGKGVVLGRIAPYRAPAPQQKLVIEATEALTLKCGEASIDLRAADGKLMVRGEDVLLRAKGTQRIKAGSVNIN